MVAGIAAAARAARYYRDTFGWNPLPSCPHGRKGPLRDFAALGCGWDTPLSGGSLAAWADCYRTPNLQLMAGVRWGLAVVDLDGPAAKAAWESLCLSRPNPRTWVVASGSGASWHLWYRTPLDLDSLPRRCVWSCGRHCRIDLLGDRSLVVAPPSLHVGTGRPYRFIVGPRQTAAPALLPGWVSALPDARLPAPAPRPRPARPHRVAPAVPRSLRRYDWRRVLDAIGDKVGLVRQWGLRLAGRANARGWVPARSIYREDRDPSASFHESGGVYSEPADRFRLSLFALAAELGVYASWQDACNHLGTLYLGATP